MKDKCVRWGIILALMLSFSGCGEENIKKTEEGLMEQTAAQAEKHQTEQMEKEQDETDPVKRAGTDKLSAYICRNGIIENMDYADKEAMLKAQGFLGQESFYCYEDTNKKLKLELYFDETSERGCGIVYDYGYNQERQETVRMYGFAFEGVTRKNRTEWKHDPYRIEGIDGKSGEELNLDGYAEDCRYTEDGRIDYFLSRGMRSEEGEAALQNILEFDFVYREDGSLAYRYYRHNPWVWGSAYTSIDSYYDEQERVLYESNYITHGSLENYYIYTDESTVPTYCMTVDENGGIAEMTVYE